MARWGAITRDGVIGGDVSEGVAADTGGVAAMALCAKNVQRKTKPVRAAKRRTKKPRLKREKHS